MGWDCYTELRHISPKEFWKKHYLPEVKDWYGKDTAEVVAENSYGSEFYAAIRRKNSNIVFGLVALIHQKGGICVKEMSSDMHPFYYNASDKVLNAITTDDDNTKEWIQKCREAKVEKKEKKSLIDSVKDGMTLKYKRTFTQNGLPWQSVVVVDKKKSLFKLVECGGLYKIGWWKKLDFEIVG